MTICPSCGKPAGGLFASLLHCDPIEPIDDIDDDTTIVRGEKG